MGTIGSVRSTNNINGRGAAEIVSLGIKWIEVQKGLIGDGWWGSYRGN